MKLRSDLILRKMGDEYVIVDPSQDVVDMSKVFTLNETAALVWQKLNDLEFTESTITDILVEHYEVDHHQALTDATLLVNQFLGEGLIEK